MTTQSSQVPRTFAIVGASTYFSFEELRILAAAARAFVNTRVAPAWGFGPIECFAVARESELAELATTSAPFVVIRVVDSDKDRPDELGDHDETPEGAPRATILAAPIYAGGGGTFDGGTAGVSLLSVILHELVEVLVDPFIADATQLPDGRWLAKEPCDPVEADALSFRFQKRDMLATNFVTPAYFNAAATVGPFDGAGVLTKPFSMSPGGYQIVTDEAGAWSNVVAAVPHDEASEPKLRAATIREQAKGPNTHGKRRHARRPAGAVRPATPHKLESLARDDAGGARPDPRQAPTIPPPPHMPSAASLEATTASARFQALRAARKAGAERAKEQRAARRTP